jgi:hypothetical protein
MEILGQSHCARPLPLIIELSEKLSDNWAISRHLATFGVFKSFSREPRFRGESAGGSVYNCGISADVSSGNSKFLVE